MDLIFKMQKICIFGSREVNITQCRDVVFNFVASTDINSIIIQGEARGVDTEARRAAEFYRRKVNSYPANWYKYCKKAGYIRNKEMFDVSDSGFAVWNGESKGTSHTYMLFLGSDKNVQIVKIDKK